MKSRTEFLNVDLELESDADLSPVADYFAERSLILFCGHIDDRWRLAIEANVADLAGKEPETLEADACIRELLPLINHLPAPLRAMWDGCTSRTFDLGVEAGAEPRPFTQLISPATLQAMTAVNAGILVTVYPCSAPKPEE